MESEPNDALNQLATNLRQMLLNEKAESDDLFQALLEKMLRVGNGVKIQIYPRDHNPPHFHVEAADKNASFDIRTGELMQGGLGHTANRIVRQYYQQNQSMLLNIWQDTRPGIISEGASYMFN